MTYNNTQDFLDFGGKNIICDKVYGGFSKPDQLAYNTVLPPPLGTGSSGVTQITGSSPVTATPAAGNVNVSLDPTSLTASNPGPVSTDYVIVWDSVALRWIKVSLSNIIASGGTVTSVGMTVPTGLTVSGSPVTTSGTLGLSWSGTIPASSLPAPTASTLGGVKSSSGITGQFVNGLDTFGNLTYGTPSGGGGGGGASNFIYANSSFIAASLTGYMTDTSSSAFTVTLPSTPSIGAWVQLMDAAGTWDSHNITLAGNGANIDSSSFNLLLNIPNSVVLCTYVNSSIGWKVFTL